MPFLSQIHVYPVKSLAGFQVQDWSVTRTGLQYDRQWMLVDEHGKFLSQRRLPKMALINTRIANQQLVLSVVGQADLILPLHGNAGEVLPVEVWGDVCQAQHCGEQADAWLSRFLDAPCRLVYHPEDQVRPVDPDYANIGDQTAYSDGFPFLLVSEASLAALNAAMSLNLAMIRFRPNLVVADCLAYAEDYWRQVTMNGIRFRLPKPCSRCSVPTIDPDTGETGKEPLTTLSRLRRWQNKVYFGQNALHDNLGLLQVGCEVQVLEIGVAQPPL